MSDRPAPYSTKSTYHQGSLFSEIEHSSLVRDQSSTYQMDGSRLQTWKQAIAMYQKQVRQFQINAQSAQGDLFDLPPAHCDPDLIDPFSLKLYPFEFYKQQFDGAGEACIYFAIDNAVPLVLYIGETIASDRRWKGVHDCKRYVDNYINLHNACSTYRAVCMAFWWDAPKHTKARKQLESSLIAKWKSPFNRENWELWQTPFTSGNTTNH